MARLQEKLSTLETTSIGTAWTNLKAFGGELVVVDSLSDSRHADASRTKAWGVDSTSNFRNLDP